MEQIIEALSESISQLMMMVIILQERNADPPPALPNGVGIVTDSASRLHQVAMALAVEDFSEYPDIRAEIEEAAESVRMSALHLQTALKSLMTTSNKQGGWEALVNSCKNMSAKTIRLLQIVYGAERERVFRAAQKALDALALVDPSAARNGKVFAERAGAAATQANQLAEYVRGKAQEAPPQKRQELLGLANELNQGATTLINDANQLLRDPANSSLQQKVTDDLNQSKGTIDRTITALKDMDREFDGAGDDFEDRSAAMMRSLRELEAGGQGFSEDMMLTAKKERQEMDNLLDDIDMGKDGAARKDLENAKLLNDRLAQLAAMESKNRTNPGERQALLDAKADLERSFPAYESAANRAMRNRDDPHSMDDLDAAHDRLDAAIGRLFDLCRKDTNAEIGASARKECEDLENLRDAARSGDADLLGRAAKALAKENKTLAGLCGAQADRMTDPFRKRQLKDAVDELERLLPHELLAGKEAILNPSAKTMKQLEEKTDTMKDQVGATATMAKNYPELDMIDAAQKEKTLLGNLSQAAGGGNARDTARFADELLTNTKNLGDIAKEIAKKKDRGQQAKILDSVNRIDRLLGPALNDANALAQRPSDGARKAALDQKTDEIRQLVDKLVADTDAGLFKECLIQSSNLHNVKNAADEGDFPAVAQSVKDTADRHKRMVPQIKAAAQRTENPQRRKQLLDDARELENLLPQCVGQANAFILKPSDASRQSLKDTVRTMEGLVAGIADPLAYNPDLPRGAAGGGGDLSRISCCMLSRLDQVSKQSG